MTVPKLQAESSAGVALGEWFISLCLADETLVSSHIRSHTINISLCGIEQKINLVHTYYSNNNTLQLHTIL